MTPQLPPRNPAPESSQIPSTVNKATRARTSDQRLVRILSGDHFGVDGRLVEVQVDVSSAGKSSFVIVGLAGKSTRESRDRIQSAIVNSGFWFPFADRVLVNLAPAFRKKDGAVFDLPVALGILLATGQVLLDGVRVGGKLRVPLGFLGELGLQGELRPVPGALLVAIALRDSGVKAVVVPRESASEVAVAPGVQVLPAGDLHEAVRALTGAEPDGEGGVCRWGMPTYEPACVGRSNVVASPAAEFADVRGQEVTKHGILVAAAGGHNLLMVGPPGVGKTMLACRVPGILPPMDCEQSLEVLRVYSVSGVEDSRGRVEERPFRAPHHTISYAGLAGGGNPPRPGELSRAHNGVLFLDELPEFSRRVLEVLRQPLESQRITIARSSGVVTFPARVLIVAAMNPCPCGYAGESSSRCRCGERVLQSYRRRVSGPLLDRIDLVLEVAQPSAAEILERGERPTGMSSESMRGHVIKARAMQKKRWSGNQLNADVPEETLLREGRLSSDALSTLVAEAGRRSLSARGMSRVLRIARTLADLAGRTDVGSGPILEALALRRRGADIQLF